MTNRIDDELSEFEYDDADNSVAEVEETPVEEPSVDKPKKTGLESKTVEELIAINLEAQRQISKQGNEIGELRKFTDDYLKKELEKETEDYSDYGGYDEDVVAIAEKVASQKVKAIEERLEVEARQRQLAKFEADHPTYKDDVADPAFQAWISESKFRSKMYQAADANDFDAADELFREWEGISKTVKSMEDEEKSTSLKAAKMETSGGSSAPKRIYSRAELINLKLRDPAKYARHADEIRLAYQENRVK